MVNTGDFVGAGGAGIIRMVIDLGPAFIVCIYSWRLIK